jgi:ABC-type transport system involved in resistance to organic solvents, periplasmic component
VNSKKTQPETIEEAPIVTTGSSGPKPNYELRVGIFTLIAFLLLFYGWTWLKSFSLIHPPQMITVQFHDIAGLASNAPVNINGVRVGTVDQIDLKGRGQVLCHLRIKTEEVVVPQGSKFTIQTLGLVGAKYVEITLPEEKPDDTPLPPIDPNTVVLGDDPVRVELVLNKIATNVNRMITDLGDNDTQSSLKDAIKHSGETIRNINEAAGKLNKNMDKVATAADTFTDTSRKIGDVASKTSTLATNANKFFVNGSGTMSNVGELSTDLKRASGKINKILDSGTMVQDLKETMVIARDAAGSIRAALKQFDDTMKDEPVKKDLLAALDKVEKSTASIAISMQAVNKLAGDQGLRSDVKEIVGNLKDSVNKLDTMIDEPGFKNDIRSTVRKVNSAAENVDGAAQQLRYALNQKGLIWKLMVGRPGHIPEPQQNQEKDTKGSKKGSKKSKKEKTKAETKPSDTTPVIPLNGATPGSTPGSVVIPAEVEIRPVPQTQSAPAQTESAQ